MKNDNYEYNVTESSVTITKYIGTSTEVVIPDTIEGFPVISIADCAFEGLSELTSVTLPSCLREIGSNAFNGCLGLVEITIPSGTMVGNYAFYGCTNTKIHKGGK